MTVPYQKISVIINPAAGRDEPILNVLNRVFYPYGIEWEARITQKFGDATRFAKEAIAAGFDLVVGYGGDGTQHEIANAVLGTGKPMGILPGGTGNGFAREMNIPKTLQAAAEVLCTSFNTRQIDVAQINEQYFVQRMYVGIEPEEQTTREMKDKFGVFAYAVNMYQRRGKETKALYRMTIDGEETVEIHAHKIYVVNSGMMGTGVAINHNYAIDDGLLDVFILNFEQFETVSAAIDRFFNFDTEKARKYYRQCREIVIETEPDQPVWSDGEYVGRTPVIVKVLPGALPIVVP